MEKKKKEKEKKSKDRFKWSIQVDGMRKNREAENLVINGGLQKRKRRMKKNEE